MGGADSRQGSNQRREHSGQSPVLRPWSNATARTLRLAGRLAVNRCHQDDPQTV